MGIYTMGPHREAALELAAIAGARTFVETGTYKGKTTRWAASQFDIVHTIEAAEPFYQRYSRELEQLGNVVTHFGDSRTELAKVADSAGDEPLLFWLDGHWSGGVTAGEQAECPILEELHSIRHRQGDVIMIDDARLFMAAPPVEFDADQWPDLFQIARCFGDDLDRLAIEIFHDIIFLVPRQPAFLDCVRKWARAHAASLRRASTG